MSRFQTEKITFCLSGILTFCQESWHQFLRKMAKRFEGPDYWQIPRFAKKTVFFCHDSCFFCAFLRNGRKKCHEFFVTVQFLTFIAFVRNGPSRPWLMNTQKNARIRDNRHIRESWYLSGILILNSFEKIHKMRCQKPWSWTLEEKKSVRVLIFSLLNVTTI